MKDIAIQQFKRDFVIKTCVQEEQFYQWLKFTFFLNHELKENYDTIYQEAFYVKLFELLTEGLRHSTEILEILKKTDKNVTKIDWYSKLTNGLNQIKSNLDESEFLYIEYRRHGASHIFQNQYEHIQDNLKIKKERKNKNLKELNNQLQAIILKYGGDRSVDEYLNQKLQPELTKIYESLK
jgi:hypothetical protein